MKKQPNIVIIGAGLTGLTTAYHLQKAGERVVVLDRAERVGGAIGTCRDGDYTYELGPNTGVIGNTDVVELFDDLADQCHLELASPSVSKRYILKGGAWHPLPLGLLDAIRTPLFTWSDKFRILGEPFRKRGSAPHETLATFVRRRLGKSFLDYAIDPFILGVYAGDPDYIVPKYALPKLYNLEQRYGSLIGGAVRKKFEPTSELEKRVSRKVFSFRGGLSSLCDALFASVGEEKFVLGAKRIRVEKVPEGFTVGYTSRDGVTHSILANQLITTVGSYELSLLLPFIPADTLSQVNNLRYTKVIEVTLGFRRWSGIPLDGFGGLIPSVENRNLLGILFMSSLFQGRSPEGGALLTVFMGGARREDLLELDDNKIRSIVEKECKDLLSIDDYNPELISVVRHVNAIPQYGAQSGIRFEAIARAEQQNEGLIIGGNPHGGIGMADRIQQGAGLARRILSPSIGVFKLKGR